MSHIKVCLSLLQLAEILSKDINICSMWGRDEVATKTVLFCEQSTDPDIGRPRLPSLQDRRARRCPLATLGRCLMQKIRIETDEYTSPLAESFASSRMDTDYNVAMYPNRLS